MGNTLSRLPLFGGCCSGGSEVASNATPLMSVRPSPIGPLLARADRIAAMQRESSTGPMSEAMCRTLHELHDWAQAELAALQSDRGAKLERIRPSGAELIHRAEQALNNQRPFDALDFYLGAYLDGAKEESLRGIRNVVRGVLEREALRSGEIAQAAQSGPLSGASNPPTPTAMRLEAEIRRSIESFFAGKD